MQFSCRMVQEGQANPGFFCDDTAIKIALGKGRGCTIEEARDWTIVGCIQPAPGGGSADGSPDAGYVNMGKMIEFVLHNGVDPATGILTGLETGVPRKFRNIEEFKEAAKKQIIHHYDQIRTGYNLMQSIHMNRYPVIFASMVTKGCVESGKSVQHWHDARDGYYAFGVDSQTMNIPHGEVTGALPDGKLAGEPLCDAAAPMMGRDVEGPTSTVKSVAAMKPEALHEGALFNLRFDPKGVAGPGSRDIIEGVIRTFFKNGGQHIQSNVVDNETLREAQKNPDHYKGLMVRVAGYMVYLTELDKSAQDAIIYRTAHLAQ